MCSCDPRWQAARTPARCRPGPCSDRWGTVLAKTASCVLVPVLDSTSLSADHNADRHFPPITCHPHSFRKLLHQRGSKLARPCLSFPGQKKQHEVCGHTEIRGGAEVLQSPQQPPARSGTPRTLLSLISGKRPSCRTPTPTSTWAHPGCAPSTRAILGQEQALSKRLSPQRPAS